MGTDDINLLGQSETFPYGYFSPCADRRFDYGIELRDFTIFPSGFKIVSGLKSTLSQLPPRGPVISSRFGLKSIYPTNSE
jgi:hypothetical protein